MRLVNVVWSGLWLGSVYSATAVALVLSFRAARFVNMSLGGILVFSAMWAAWLQGHGVGVMATLVIATLGAVIISLAQQWLVGERIEDAPAQQQLLATLAVAVLLSGISNLLFGSQPVTGRGLGGSGQLRIGLWRPTVNSLVLVGAVLVVCGAVWISGRRTIVGKAVMAAGYDSVAMRLMGLSARRLRRVALGVCGLIVGLAGCLFLPLGVVDFSQGLSFTVFGFVAAAAVGYESLGAAVLAGLGFGVVAALGTTYLTSAFSQAISFGILAAAVLIGRRSGLLRAIS